MCTRRTQLRNSNGIWLFASILVAAISLTGTVSAESDGWTKQELRIGATVLTSNICAQFSGDDQYTYKRTKGLVEKHLIDYGFVASEETLTPKEVVSFLNDYKNDMFCVDADSNIINYMAYSLERKKNHGLFDLYFFDDLLERQSDVLIDFNAISLFVTDRYGKKLKEPRYETVLDSAVRECNSTKLISICELVELLEDDHELGAKRFVELTEAEKRLFAPLPEVFEDM